VGHRGRRGKTKGCSGSTVFEVCVCSAVSYFSTLVGSIIGAGRLSFRVRDGSGRFPVAITAVTLFKFVLVVGCSGLRVSGLVVACV
jgi:hypothetical protein